jgi:hypothetical protein
MTRFGRFALILSVFVLWALAFNVFAGMVMTPGTAAHTHSDANTGGGTLAVSGTLSSTKACASGYTRIGPNFCGSTSAYSTPVLTLDACTALTKPATDATALLISASVVLRTNNTVSQKFAQIDAFNDAGCATVLDRVQWRAYENPADPVLNNIGGGSVNMIVRGGSPYVKFSDDTTNQATGAYMIIGYFD